jgi:hypothetical protein
VRGSCALRDEVQRLELQLVASRFDSAYGGELAVECIDLGAAVDIAVVRVAVVTAAARRPLGLSATAALPLHRRRRHLPSWVADWGPLRPATPCCITARDTFSLYAKSAPSKSTSL